MRIMRVPSHTASRVCVLFFAIAFVVSVLPPFSAQLANAQRREVAPSGDSPADAGPLAHLSAKITRRDVGKAMKLVADWQLSRMPAQPQYDWTWAALYTGFMGVPQKIAGDKYKNAVMKIGEESNWQPGPRVMHADDQAVGQSYLELYTIHKDPKMIGPMRARLDTEISTPESEYGKTPLWWWCDALFMAPPVFADMTAATGDEKYLSFMDRQWEITTKLLYDPSVHLYSRDATYLDKHEKNGQKIFWSRGNGWVMGGIVRVLQELPKDSPLRPKFEDELRQMAAEMVSIQSKDGLWRPGLLDADSYPLPEISGSAFITYAMAYGVNQGILDKAKYWPAVEKAWAGMLSHVYADGRLGCIQPVGAAPGAYTETSSYVYGVGAYLLAGSEIYRTAK
ncbi:MAG TPA: glycoside hydrolase family 88 protein [Terracidiphilus sp.]|nr:glycoside hydrolase family 88 protein [Terracidiphilus sp.]